MVGRIRRRFGVSSSARYGMTNSLHGATWCWSLVREDRIRRRFCMYWRFCARPWVTSSSRTASITASGPRLRGSSRWRAISAKSSTYRLRSHGLTSRLDRTYKLVLARRDITRFNERPFERERASLRRATPPMIVRKLCFCVFCVEPVREVLPFFPRVRRHP